MLPGMPLKWTQMNVSKLDAAWIRVWRIKIWMAGCNSDAASPLLCSAVCRGKSPPPPLASSPPPALLSPPPSSLAGETANTDRAYTGHASNQASLDPKRPFLERYLHSQHFSEVSFVYYETVWSHRNPIVWVWTAIPSTVARASHLLYTRIPQWVERNSVMLTLSDIWHSISAAMTWQTLKHNLKMLPWY